MMPGTVTPVQGVVLNEKAFHYANLPFDGALLDERSGYGPFTTRLASHAIDLAIADAGSDGMALSYRLPDDPPELVADYFAWLWETFGLRPDDEAHVALFAHASNGGIRIASDASCVGGPVGLYACGECTGGMHGADRLGGLASASALVFGRIAGQQAARVAGHGHAPVAEVACELEASLQAPALLCQLQEVMSAYAMVNRTNEGLGCILRQIADLGRCLRETFLPTDISSRAAVSGRLAHQLAAAQAMVQAMCDRTESCGSHRRADQDGSE